MIEEIKKWAKECKLHLGGEHRVAEFIRIIEAIENDLYVVDSQDIKMMNYAIGDAEAKLASRFYVGMACNKQDIADMKKLMQSGPSYRPGKFFKYE